MPNPMSFNEHAMINRLPSFTHKGEGLMKGFFHIFSCHFSNICTIRNDLPLLFFEKPVVHEFFQQRIMRTRFKSMSIQIHPMWTFDVMKKSLFGHFARHSKYSIPIFFVSSLIEKWCQVRLQTFLKISLVQKNAQK